MTDLRESFRGLSPGWQRLCSYFVVPSPAVNGDSSYVGSKVSLQTDSKSCWRPSWRKMGVR